MPKWKTFIFKLLYNGLAFKDNLQLRQINVNPSCVFCGHSMQDAQHLFRFCGISRHVWASCTLGKSQSSPSNLDFRLFILNKHQDGNTTTRSVLFISILWSIWVVRNEVIFRGSNAGPSDIMAKITQVIDNHSTFEIHQQLNRNSTIPLDTDTPPGFICANIGHSTYGSSTFTLLVDGSWHPSDHTYACAQLLVNDNNRGGCVVGTTSSAYHVEALAILNALTWAQDCLDDEITVL